MSRDNFDVKSTVGLSTNLKNFLLYVYSISALGVGIVFLIAFLFSLVFKYLLLVTQTHWVLSIPLLIVFFLQSYVVSEFGDLGKVLRRQTSSLLLMLGLKIFLGGILLSPLILVASMLDPSAIILSFAITLITFVVFALYVFMSGHDLAFRKSEDGAKTFKRIVLFMCIVSLVLSLLIMICSFISPALASMFYNIYLVFALILSLIFVLYTNALIRDMYDEYAYDGIALARLGVAGSSMVIGTFISLFSVILRILLRIRKKD